MGTPLRSGDTFLFIGDSITDCGRRDPDGRPLGHGYVRMLRNLFLVREPEKTLSIVNRGIGGNTADDLRSRWADDALAYEPHWLSLLIGINDVNRLLMGGDPALFEPAAFGAIVRSLLQRTRDALPHVRFVMIEPFLMSRDAVGGPGYRAKMLAKLAEFQHEIRTASEAFQAVHVPMHGLFQRQLRHHRPEVYGEEPVHPNDCGHLLMAHAVWDALEAAPRS